MAGHTAPHDSGHPDSGRSHRAARRPHPPGRRRRRRPRRRPAARHPGHGPALPARRGGAPATSGSPAWCCPRPGTARRPRWSCPGWRRRVAPHLALDDLGVEVVTWNDGEDPYLLVSDLAGGPTRLAVADTMPAKHVFGAARGAARRHASLAGPIAARAADAQGRRRGRASCGPRAPRSTACTPGWASSSRRAAPRRRSARTSPRRSSRRATPRRRSSSSARGPTAPARTTTCRTG